MKKIVLCILIILTIGVISTLSVYQYNNLNGNKENILEDKTEESQLAMYLIDENGNQTATEEFPSSTEYMLDTLKSTCKNNSLIEWDKETSKVKIIASKADSCNIYFRKNTTYNLKSHIIATNNIISTNPSFKTATTDGEYGLYKAEDDYGTSYYFRGDVENNYVEFGTYAKAHTVELYKDASITVNNETIAQGTKMYWRIVRINGDGTIRMVYAGTSAIANGTSNAEAITASVFTETDEGIQSVGYVAGTGTSPYINAYASTIKTVVEGWYNDQLKASYGSYIADRIFCNDRSLTEGDTTYFGSYTRITNGEPKLTCVRDDDKLTVENEVLTAPVGLITADEVALAGGYSDNSTYYLYSGHPFWTMSPNLYNATPGAYVYYVDGYGGLQARNVMNSNDSEFVTVRPVININADILFTGTGKIDDPYKLAS